MPLRLFEGYGVELEYMLVDAESLDVRPVADRILAAKAGEDVSDLEDGGLGWSNELVLHVLELKTNGPAASLEATLPEFRRGIAEANALAVKEGARLLPTAMHPWMDPLRETRLWPHEYGPVYRAFDRIFGCSGHGWSNLQSTHLNLPFGDDEEFGRLHAAIRAVLPLLSPLAASSPVVEGRLTGVPDNRLEFYRNNARKIPSVAGEVVPEPVYSRESYERDVLGRIYADLAPHDPEGILRNEWVNSRGAIARFDRDAIEIRLLDVQECPSADLAILAMVVAVVRALSEERWVSLPVLGGLSTSMLAGQFRRLSARGLDSLVEPEGPAEAKEVELWTAAVGGKVTLTVRELWQHVLEVLATDEPTDPIRPGSPLRRVAETILAEGSVSERISRRFRDQKNVTRGHLRLVYQELADCLANDTLFA